MSEPTITALIAAAATLVGCVLTYLNTRRKEQKQLNEAELDYMVRLQEMLVDSAKRLTEAEVAHTQRIIVLERDKYYAEEELKRAKIEHQQELRTLQIVSNDQDLEIKQCIAESELYEQEIRRLNGILSEQGIPIIKFSLPRRKG